MGGRASSRLANALAKRPMIALTATTPITRITGRHRASDRLPLQLLVILLRAQHSVSLERSPPASFKPSLGRTFPYGAGRRVDCQRSTPSRERRGVHSQIPNAERACLASSFNSHRRAARDHRA